MSYINEMAVQFPSKKEMNKFKKAYKQQLKKLEKNAHTPDPYTSYFNIFEESSSVYVENEGEPIIYFPFISFWPGDTEDKGASLLLDMAHDTKYNVRLIRIGEEAGDIQTIDEKPDFFDRPITLGITILTKTGTQPIN